MAGIATLEGAKEFLRRCHIAIFNQQFTVAAAEKGTGFRRTSRSGLNWIFTIQTERAVAKDNTVWRTATDLEKSRFRSSLAGCTVTIHQHLDGPHVVGRYTATDEIRPASVDKLPESRAERGAHHSEAAPLSLAKIRKPPSASRRGSADLTIGRPNKRSA